LPSLKEFEALARAALGSDEGIAPVEPEAAPEAAPAGEAETPAFANSPETSGADEPPIAASAEASEPVESTTPESANSADVQTELKPAEPLAESAS